MTNVHDLRCVVVGIWFVALFPVLAESSGIGVSFASRNSSEADDVAPGVRADSRRQSSDTVEPTLSADAPAWKFDAGGSLVLPGLYGFRAVGAGGWLTVGSGRLRLQIDYLHRRGHEEDSEIFNYGDFVREYTHIDGWTVASLHVVASRHFRTESMVKPHVLFGAGYYGSRGYNCRASSGRFEGNLVYERPQECDRDEDDDIAGVLGGGIEIAYGSRFFIRAQSRGFVVAGGDDSSPSWLRLLQATMSEVLVGVGVRF